MSVVVIPSTRVLRGTLDEPLPRTSLEESVESGDGSRTDNSAIVVACAPHPQHGGSRSDQRLRTVSDALIARGIFCLRFDYGSWDGGLGERIDTCNAISWAGERYNSVGLFGFSFGAGQALLASATADTTPQAVSALAPPARVSDDLEVVTALESLEIPVQLIYGARDSTVEWKPVVEAARTRGDTVVELPADHFFLGKHEQIGEHVARFFEETLLE